MKKGAYTVLLGLTATALLSGCSADTAKNEEPKKETEVQTEYSTAAPADIADEDIILEEIETESEVPLEPITPSDYLIKDAADYVTLGDLKGLAVTQYVYEVTDEMVQETIDNELQMSSIETEVDRPSAADDVIYLDMTYTVSDGSEPTSESTYFYIGMEEYGADFDKELIGLSAGDQKKFSVSFDESAIMEEWTDQTVEFDITVSMVCEISTPEYTDAYVQEFMGFDTIADYEASIREYMEADYADTSYTDTIYALFEEAVHQSTFNGYPQEFYDSCKEETIRFYTDYTGGSSIEDVYELFGLTEEDINAEILDTVNLRLMISQLCAEQNLEVTSEEYMDYVADNAAYYGYGNAASFEQDYGRESLVWTLYESKAGEFLYDAAQITEAAYEEDLFIDAELIEDSSEYYLDEGDGSDSEIEVFEADFIEETDLLSE